MKKVLFVVNTMGRAGAEMALIELLSLLCEEYDISLRVLSGQGELKNLIPAKVKVLDDLDPTPVVSVKGQRKLKMHLFGRAILTGKIFGFVPFYLKHRKEASLAVLSRRLLADSAKKDTTNYDAAIAFMEGGAQRYVDRYVLAKRKFAFVHIDYAKAGYKRSFDDESYLRFDAIFAVSKETKANFEKVYPECSQKVYVCENIINEKKIHQLALCSPEKKVKDDKPYILTVGRLEPQKAFEISIQAMAILKQKQVPVRWVVLGEGSLRNYLEKEIRQFGLEDDFLFPGAVENPYPYFKEAILYVHASRFEGKSIAIREAKILGKCIVVSDCSGNREQIKDNETGCVVPLESKALADKIMQLLNHPEQMKEFGKSAALSYENDKSDASILKRFLEEI